MEMTRGRAVRVDRRDIAIAIVVNALAVIVAIAAERPLGLTSAALILVMGVMIVALQTQRPMAVISALVSFLTYDYLLVEPRGAFTMAKPEEIVAVAMFLFAALVVEHLASKARAQVDALRVSNAHVVAVCELGRRLSCAVDAKTACAATAAALRAALNAEIIVVETGSGAPAIRHADPPGTYVPEPELQQGIAALRTDGDQPMVPPAAWWFARCAADTVIGTRLAAIDHVSAESTQSLAVAMLDDLSQTLERIRLAADLESTRIKGETERLRAALLSSVSHDLRSPLAGMIGAVTSLTAFGPSMSASDRQVLLDSILHEGQRLDRYIQNLLDMTRLEHGGLAPARDWIGADDIIGAAVARLERLEPLAEIDVALQPDLPLLNVHPALVEQALFNLLENAAKFSPQGAVVTVRAYREGDTLSMDVEDLGPGISAEERSRVFDRFYSVSKGDRSGPSTGLGLTICQGMIEAHGGTVEALSHPSGPGTLMRIRLPLPSAPIPETEET